MSLLDKAGEILEGWAAYTHLHELDQVQKEEANRRAKICATCPFMEKFSLLSFLKDNENKEIQGYKCSKCGCPLSTKIRSTSSKCPENKW